MNKCDKCTHKTSKIDIVFKRKTDDDLINNLNKLLDKWTCKRDANNPIPGNVDSFVIYVERKVTLENCIDDLKKVLSNV
jgi:hypothetical protein